MDITIFCSGSTPSLPHLFRVSQDLFDEYHVAQRKVFAGDNVGLQRALCTPDYFYKVGAEHFPYLKLRPHGDFMLCEICTLLKSSIHGQIGSRAIQDEAHTKVHKQTYDAHIEVLTTAVALGRKEPATCCSASCCCCTFVDNSGDVSRTIPLPSYIWKSRRLPALSTTEQTTGIGDDEAALTLSPSPHFILFIVCGFQNRIYGKTVSMVRC